jgi:hypothetical protein
MRTLGFIQLCCLAACNIGVKPRVPPRKTGALVDWKSFKEPRYVLFAIGMFFVSLPLLIILLSNPSIPWHSAVHLMLIINDRPAQNFWGVYFPFYYLTFFARSVIDTSYTQSINLLITLNGVGVLGRIVPNFLADRFLGPLNTLIPVVLLSAALTYAWIGVSATGGLYAWTIVYGIMGAGIQGLFAPTLSSLTTNLRMQGTRMGMVFTIVSFAVLTGPPIAGQLIQDKGGGYEYAEVFAGSALLIGCGFLVAARLAKDRRISVKM